MLLYEILDIFGHHGIVVPRMMGRVAMVAQVLWGVCELVAREGILHENVQ